MSEKKIMGQRIRERRGACRLSQDERADLAGLSGAEVRILCSCAIKTVKSVDSIDTFSYFYGNFYGNRKKTEGCC